jgi:hypothetical protein
MPVIACRHRAYADAVTGLSIHTLVAADRTARST